MTKECYVTWLEGNGNHELDKEGSCQALVDGGRGGGGGRLGGGGALVTSFEPDNGTVFCGT